MDAKRVLIFPAGTEIAFEIQNALKFSKFVELYGANSIPSHADFVFKKCESNLPFENEHDFISALNEVLDRWEIDYIYPARDSSLCLLTKEQDRIHATVVTSPLSTVELCRSKNLTYEFFKGEDFIPKFYYSVDDIDKFPVFIKPTVGQGSVGAKKISSKIELERELKSDTEYAICEYLPGNEYTVDCFTDRHGVLRTFHIRQRESIKNGISVRSSLVPADDRIKKIAEKINDRLIFNGAWFFQVKKNLQNEYRLMEISPRIPGTMGTSRNLGINYPLLTLYNMWGYDVDIIDNGTEITVDRALISRYKTSITYGKVYLDFDDTVYIENKVNIAVISFLYQCINKQIKIILLTKHDKDLHSSLDKFRISEALFDEIIQIKKGEDKSKYITDLNSIFIDDSFSERLNIHNKTGIPVFDLDMIESLFDWRM